MSAAGTEILELRSEVPEVPVVPEDKKVIYENFLKKYFGDKVEGFKNALKESKALTAGGSALAAMLDNKDYEGDIDIYVNVENARPIRNFLSSFRSDVYISKRNSENKYAKFFFDINKIARIVRFEFGKSKSIDLVYINNSRTPESVVSNFDFTCCQVWYDGDNMFASHPELTMEMKANINKDYIAFYFSPDKYAKKRLDKYRSKGFDIKISPMEFDIELPVLDSDVSDKELALHCVYGWTMNYLSFVAGINSRLFRRCRFQTYEIPNITSEPALIQRNLFVFNSDLFDERDFKSLDDYRKIGMYEKAKNNIITAFKFINSELSYTHQRDKKYRNMMNVKEILQSEFKDIIKSSAPVSPKTNKSSPTVCGGEAEESRESILGYSDNAYPEIEQTCWVESMKNDIPMGLYLSDKNNIVIRVDGKYLGFKRDFIIRQFRTNKLFGMTKILDSIINYDDFNRLDNPTYKYFELCESGFYSDKMKGNVFNIIPYTVKILKKHLKV
jgi:hypothetical protein